MVVWLEFENERARRLLKLLGEEADASRIHRALERGGVRINREFGGVTVVRVPPDNIFILIAVDDDQEPRLREVIKREVVIKGRRERLFEDKEIDEMRTKFTGKEKRLTGRIFEVIRGRDNKDF